MSVLSEVVTKVKSAAGQTAATGGLMKLLVDYLQRADTGGLPGVMQKFEKAGLGSQVQSWLGTGKSLPITPEEVTRALGNGEISQMAAKAGLSTEQVSQQLAGLLPQAVKNLVPGGTAPAAGMLGGLGTAIKEKLGK